MADLKAVVPQGYEGDYSYGGNTIPPIRELHAVGCLLNFGPVVPTQGAVVSIYIKIDTVPTCLTCTTKHMLVHRPDDVLKPLCRWH